MAAVLAFLGRVADPEAPGGGAARPQDFNSAYRAIMFTDIVAGGGSQTDARSNTCSDGIMAAFAEPTSALRRAPGASSGRSRTSIAPATTRCACGSACMPASRWSRTPTCSAPRCRMAVRLCDAAAADDATPLGPIALKGFAEPVRVFSIGWQ